MSSINIPQAIKLLAQIGNVIHEVGEYSAPIVETIVRMRDKGPVAPDGTERTAVAVQMTIDHALGNAREGQRVATGELDKLASKVGELKAASEKTAGG